MRRVFWAEFQCPECEEVWEARVRSYYVGDGDYEYVAVAEDSPTGYMTSLECENCGVEGERV
jgi:hypothetical protein